VSLKYCDIFNRRGSPVSVFCHEICRNSNDEMKILISLCIEQYLQVQVLLKIHVLLFSMNCTVVR
jgi:hypothetical protein